MEKRLFVQLNGNRKVIGVLRGYDVRTRFLLSPFSSHFYDRRHRYLLTVQGGTNDPPCL
jgi:small nuclear ribonucleoprotein G